MDYLVTFLGGSLITLIVDILWRRHDRRRDNQEEVAGSLGRIFGMLKISEPENVIATYYGNIPHITGYFGRFYRDIFSKTSCRSAFVELLEINPKNTEESKKQIMHKIEELVVCIYEA